MTSRKSQISSHLLVAEMIAFPFSSTAASSTCLTSLDPLLHDPATQALWRAAEREILGTIPSVTLDEFIAYRDDLWFGHHFDTERTMTDPGAQPRRLLEMLESASKRLLRIEGNVATPQLLAHDFIGQVDRGPQHARDLWKWVIVTMPPDLLVAGLRKGVTEIDSLSPSLAGNLFDNGFAELHLHFGAGLEFADFWGSACEAMVWGTAKPDMFKSPGGVGADEGKSLGSWIARACVTRYVLTLFLVNSARPTSFSEFARVLQPDLRRSIGLIPALTIIDAIRDMEHGRFSTTEEPRIFYEIQIAFRRLRESSLGASRSWSQRKEPPQPNEALAELLCGGDREITGTVVEHDFLRRAFAYMADTPSDELFASLFWQATRVRCMLYRHVVQRPMTPGLPWFIRAYSRMSVGKKPLSEVQRLTLAAKTSGAGKGLRSLEYRTSPKGDTGATLTLLRNLREQHQGSAGGDGLRRRGIHEVGVVLHFARDRGGGMARGIPGAYGGASEAQPSAVRGARFGGWYRTQREQAYGMATVLRNFPETLELLRGIDVCADEAGVPTWVLKPLVNYVQASARSAALRLRHFTPGAPIRFNTTAHAGEDWLHLLGGIRRIHEAIEHFEMSSGDRLGHALALGVDPKRWARETGPVAMTLEERLFDLVWAWQRLVALGERGSTTLEDEIRRHFDEMFDTDGGSSRREDSSPWVAAQMIGQLYDADALRRIRYPGTTFTRQSDRAPAATRFFAHYLFDENVFRRGRRIIYVDAARDEELTGQLQGWLHREVANLGLVIEVNPSSNFLTNQLASLREHPVWRLRSPRGESTLPRVAVVLGSDDPLTFATTLPAEYQLMHDALMLEGLTTEEADRWIEDARINGLTHRWTRPSKLHLERFRRRHEEQPRRPVPFDYAHSDDDVPLPP